MTATSLPPLSPTSAASASPEIAVAGVRHVFAAGGELLALDGVDLTVAPGEFVALVGESGCGKSTLLRLIAGLLTPTAGRVTLGGAPVEGPRADVALVFQRSVLLEWRTVLDNVLLPVEIRGLPRARYEAEARALLDAVGLAGFERRRPRQLSGGMQQRVALAQALLLQPAVLLLDEPFGALDAITREQLNLELLSLWEARRSSVVFVTHDLAEAVFLADRVVLLTRRPGRVAASFPVPLPRPRTLDQRYGAEFADLCRDVKHAMAQ
ncbi:MAG TPA: ABC transporter ATP-binding protein [Chloroflexota bacterium]|nr:ABC transporter ATP-binding protein [Chloroflexota bacterium]